MQPDMLSQLQAQWGWIVLRGIAAVLFAAATVAWPGITLAALVIVWGGYALEDGLLALVAAWQVRGEGWPFWSLVVARLLGIAAGAVTFLGPQITALTLLMVVAAWAMLMGGFQIVAAIRLRKENGANGCWRCPACCRSPSGP